MKEVNTILVKQLANYLNSILVEKGEYSIYNGGIEITDNIVVTDYPLISFSIDDKNKVLRIFDSRVQDEELTAYEQIKLD
jgi:hypothetical protein